MNDFLAEWFVALQRLVPHHQVSRLLSKLAESTNPRTKNLLIRHFIKTYSVNMAEAAYSSENDYASFNAFFTRSLKSGSRPIDTTPGSVVSPADGTISQLGKITQGDIFQAKGKHFSVDELLGEQSTDFMNGHFATVYLSPRDYHRVHMPVSGTLDYCRYIPGKLFSVNTTTTSHIDGLFAKNERLVSFFNTEIGRCAVVMVGAMLVAGIETVWGNYTPAKMNTAQFAEGQWTLKKGEEMGRFKFGSTVILLFEENSVTWEDDCIPATTILVGKKMGQH
ncbi:archaetidylserine decarboxylase [Porticoccus sp.]|uniref:archaetidylserine decarboxylase n=1 Tax=Porticoccus sp. TaxID=2024853 RepID=UPI003F695349